jgi:hypothetical protein
LEHIAPAKKGRRSGIKVTRLLRELSEDEEIEDKDSDDEMPESVTVTPVDQRKPWLKEFNYYINMFDQLSENQTIVQWWGVSFDSWFN